MYLQHCSQLHELCNYVREEERRPCHPRERLQICFHLQVCMIGAVALPLEAWHRQICQGRRVADEMEMHVLVGTVQ